MNEEDIERLVNAFGASAFFLIITVCVVSTISRAIRYTLSGQEFPLLLIRDLILFLSIGGFITVVFAVRAIGGSLAHNIPWLIGSTIVLLFGFGTYAYFELFVIERVEKRRRETKERDGNKTAGP